MSIFHAIILGIVQGITEFLPISSTGHLILVSRLLDLTQTDFVKTFQISVQLGSILAVVFLFGKKILVDRETLKKVLLAFIPTGVIGFLLYQFIKGFLLGNELVVIASLFIVGVFLILAETVMKGREFKTKDIKNLSYKQSFFIGVIQSLGMIPGVSRSGATIIGGLIMGIDRKTIIDFSLLLAIPTMMAATGYDLLKSYQAFSLNQFYILIIGFVVAFLVAVPAIQFLVKYVKNNNFIVFGVYRIIVAILFLFLIL